MVIHHAWGFCLKGFKDSWEHFIFWKPSRPHVLTDTDSIHYLLPCLPLEYTDYPSITSEGIANHYRPMTIFFTNRRYSRPYLRSFQLFLRLSQLRSRLRSRLLQWSSSPRGPQAYFTVWSVSVATLWYSISWPSDILATSAIASFEGLYWVFMLYLFLKF